MDLNVSLVYASNLITQRVNASVLLMLQVTLASNLHILNINVRPLVTLIFVLTNLKMSPRLDSFLSLANPQ